MPAGMRMNDGGEGLPLAERRLRANRLPRFVDRALAGYAVIIILAAWAFGLWHIYRERIDAYQRAQRQLVTLAVGVSQHVEAMLNDGIGAARAAANVIDLEKGLDSDTVAVTTALRRMLTGGEYVKGLFVFSAGRYVQAGRVAAEDIAGSAPAWLQTLPDTASELPWVGAPVPVAGSFGGALLPVAVPVQSPSGSTIWVGALFGIESIQALYERQQFAGVVALISREGNMLARVPTLPDGPPVLSESVRKAFNAAIAVGWLSAIELIGPITGEPVILMGRPVAGYPIVSVVSLQKRAIFAPWASQSQNTLAQLAAATFVIVLLTWFLRHSIAVLKEQETQYHAFLDNAGVSIFLIEDDTFLEMNRKTREMFGLPDDQVLADLRIMDISPPMQPGGETSERLALDYLAAVRKQGQISFRWTHRRMDTLESFPTEVSLSTLTGGKSARMLAIVHDLSDVERARNSLVELNADLERRVQERTRDLERANLQLAMANQELESFTASASHDLRSPLGSISGMAELLRAEISEGRNDTANHRIARIQEGVKRMAEVIDGLLNLARMTSHEGNFETVDLSELANDIEAELRQQYPNHPMTTLFEPGLIVNADPRLMRTIVSNLLGNAWKYTGKTIGPKVELNRVLGDHGLYEYRLHDNGVGFDMRYAEKLFKPFRRLHSSEQFPGIGIGLATVARIVRCYGGQIWAESQPDKGTTFYFTLPNAQNPPVGRPKSADAA